MKSKIQASFLFLLSLLIFSCSPEGKNAKSEKQTNPKEDRVPNKVKEERIKNIFYSLPSPLELSMLFKQEGVNYQKSKLHDIEKRDQYVTTVKQSLNLGIYGADLSYAGLFGKHQEAIEYFAACQNVASDLSLSQAFQKEFITRLENNPNNKDTLLQVISDFFIENDTYLKDHSQSKISTYILVGGWIEGLYLGTSMVSEKTDAVGIREIIIGQLNSLENLIFLLEDVGKSQEMSELKVNMLSLRDYYNEIVYQQIAETEMQESESDELILDSGKGEAIMHDSTFVKVKNIVSEIRASIIR